MAPRNNRSRGKAKSGGDRPPGASAVLPSAAAEVRDASLASDKLDAILAHLSRSDKRTTNKDRYDKFQILSSTAIALAALLFAFLSGSRDSNQRAQFHQTEVAQRDSAQVENLRVQELQLINAFLPHLTGSDEKKKELAVLAVRHLGSPGLAQLFAGIQPSPGTAAGLNIIRASPNVAEQERARIDTVLSEFPAGTQEILEILDVPGGGLRPNVVFETDTTPSAPPSPGTRKGTGRCGLWRDAAGAYWCSGPCREGQACGVISVEDS